MVSQAEGEQSGKRKRSPINLHGREFHYTLPSGEVVIVAPHKGSRGLVTLPDGTTVKVVKLQLDDSGKNVDTN